MPTAPIPIFRQYLPMVRGGLYESLLVAKTLAPLPPAIHLLLRASSEKR